MNQLEERERLQQVVHNLQQLERQQPHRFQHSMQSQLVERHSRDRERHQHQRLKLNHERLEQL
jgi:hypothetical protein